MTSQPPNAKSRPAYGPQFVVADVLTFLIPMLILFAEEGGVVRLANQALVGVLLLMCFAFQLYYRHTFITDIPEVWLLVAFTVWAGATGFLVAGDTEEFKNYFMRTARICGLVVALGGLAEIKRSPTVNLVAVIVMSLWIAVLARLLGLYSLGFDTGFSSQESPWNANLVGLTMLSAIYGLAYLWGKNNLRLIRLFRWAIPLLAIILVLTMVSFASRKSFAAFLMFVFLWLWFCYRRQVFKNLGAFLLVGAVLASSYLFTAYILKHTRLGARYETTGGWLDTGTSKRFTMYADAGKYFLESPIWGTGLGGFEARYEERCFSHSDYAEVFSTTGLVGAALYFPIYFIWWRRLRRIERATADPEVRYQAGLFKAILLVLVCLGFGVVNFVETQQWYWLAALIGYSRALELDLREPKRPT
jgi:O-antigen ligase